MKAIFRNATLLLLLVSTVSVPRFAPYKSDGPMPCPNSLPNPCPSLSPNLQIPPLVTGVAIDREHLTHGA